MVTFRGQLHTCSLKPYLALTIKKRPAEVDHSSHKKLPFPLPRANLGAIRWWNGVVNVVDELQTRGFDPRRVGRDSWEAPAQHTKARTMR